jgi:hypothetical protein
MLNIQKEASKIKRIARSKSLNATKNGTVEKQRCFLCSKWEKLNKEDGNTCLLKIQTTLELNKACIWNYIK